MDLLQILKTRGSKSLGWSGSHVEGHAEETFHDPELITTITRFANDLT